MEIDEKDIIFGVIRRRDGRTAVMCHMDEGKDNMTVFGVLTYIAAHDGSFLKGLEGVVANVRSNGGKIRELARREAAEGKLVSVDKDRIKS